MERFDDNWIQFLNKELSPIADKINRNYRRRENSRESHKIGLKKYEKTEKGKQARKKAQQIRKIRKNSAHICLWEKEQILKFYNECPPGFHVDHIYPLSRGGSHSLSNLQRLSKKANLKKSNFIIHTLDCEYPHCKINIEQYYLNF